MRREVLSPDRGLSMKMDAPARRISNGLNRRGSVYRALEREAVTQGNIAAHRLARCTRTKRRFDLR